MFCFISCCGGICNVGTLMDDAGAHPIGFPSLTILYGAALPPIISPIINPFHPIAFV